MFLILQLANDLCLSDVLQKVQSRLPPSALRHHQRVTTPRWWSPRPPPALHHHQRVTTTRWWSPRPPPALHHHHQRVTTTRWRLHLFYYLNSLYQPTGAKTVTKTSRKMHEKGSNDGLPSFEVSPPKQ